MRIEGMHDNGFIFETDLPFEEKAFQVFEFQKRENKIYGKFLNALGVGKVKEPSEIPLLPIQAFRDAKVYIAEKEPELFFQSSGTTGMHPSRHYIADADIYQQSIHKGFNLVYGSDDWIILAYTPGYNENPNSSLIYMLNSLIQRDQSGLSQFLAMDMKIDHDLLQSIKSSGKRLMLFGAAFGLMDLADTYPVSLPEGSMIVETGGMKTHRREMRRQQMHQKLSEAFAVPKSAVHSEYGMTELLSQAWSSGDDWFRCPHWMRVSIRNPENPMQELPTGEEGLIGVIDLANLYSCSFLLTGDKGVMRVDGSFQVLGRWRPVNLRGCNFLIDRD